MDYWAASVFEAMLIKKVIELIAMTEAIIPPTYIGSRKL
jgi:hypothetical protein